MSVKISPKIPPMHRKALKDFVQNPYVAALLVVGEFDHLLPQDVREQAIKDRVKDPGLVLIAKERIERGVKAGEVKPDALWATRRKELRAEDDARKAARRAKYGK